MKVKLFRSATGKVHLLKTPEERWQTREETWCGQRVETMSFGQRDVVEEFEGEVGDVDCRRCINWKAARDRRIGVVDE